MLERDLAIGGVSVCPSHSGNASKLMNLGSFRFTDGYSPGTLFFDTNFDTVDRRDS